MMEDDATVSASTGSPCYRFADFMVDTHAHALTRGDQALPLEPKSYGVLLALLRKPGELLTRDELLDEVWGHRHVTPGVLTRAVAQLRHALDDDPHEPRYIRTRHALGYCFIAPVEEVAWSDTGVRVTGSQPVVEDAVAEPAPAAEVSDAPDGTAAQASSPQDKAASSPDGSTHSARRADDMQSTEAPIDRRAPTGIAGAARRWWLPVLLAGLAGSVVLFAWTFIGRQARAVEPSIAVLPFASVGNAEGDRYFAEGLAVEMHDALAAVPGLDVVAVRGLEAADRDARKLGKRLGVAHVLDARVRREGSRIRVTAWLTDTRTGVTRWSGRFDRDAASVFAVQGEVASEVVRALKGIVPAAALDTRLRPTNDFAAYDAYLRGLRALATGGGDVHLAAAVAHFEQALQRDPSFARARAGLCRAELARFEDRLDALAFARAERACRQAAASAPELREVDLAMGELYRTRGDPRGAVAHYMRALDDVALRAPAHVGLAQASAALRRPDDARRHFAEALRLQPNDASIHREHGYQRYIDGDLPGAIASYRRATELAPGDERLWSSLGGLLLASGDAAGAKAAFERSLAVRPNYAALSNYGSLRFEAREYAEAEALYRRAADIDPADFRLWGNLGDAASAQPGQSYRARSAYERAARMARDYVAIRADDAQALALLAWYRASLGDVEGARSALARAEGLGTEPGEVAFLGAQVHVLLGEREGARRRIDAATRHGIPTRRLAASPTLAPLMPGRVARR